MVTATANYGSEELPRVMRQHREALENSAQTVRRIAEPDDYDEFESGADMMTRWFWPSSAWLLLLFNAAMMVIASIDMLSKGYNFTSHFTVLTIACLGYVCYAAVHRWVLTRQSVPMQPTVDQG